MRTQDFDSVIEYETTTKAQRALESVIGDHATWVRSCVFQQGAPSLASATDAERKRLLESLLGLDDFDVALDACRLDAKTAAAVYETAKLLQAKAATRASTLLSEIAGWEAPRDQARFPSEEDVVLLRRELDATQADARRTSLPPPTQDFYIAEQEAKRRRQEAAALEKGTCPTCHQAIPAALLRDLQHARDEAELALDAARAALTAAVTEQKASQRSAAARADVAQEAYTQAAAALAQAEQHAALIRRRERLAQEVEEARLEEARLAETAAREGGRTQVLEHVERVLGIRGFRAHILGGMLGALSHAAQAWLSRLAGRPVGLRLTLGGKRDDQVVLDVSGYGGAYGYVGASGGERRRVDVALLFALAGITAASTGRAPGTLWLDEVLDALDDQGVEAVAGALEDLARDRCVVVITHSADLARELPAVKRVVLAQPPTR